MTVLYFSSDENYEMVYTSHLSVYKLLQENNKVYFINTTRFNLGNNTYIQKYINKHVKNLNKLTEYFKLNDVTAIIQSSPKQWNHLINTYSKYVKSFNSIIAKYSCDFNKILESDVKYINDSCVTKIIVPSSFCRNSLINSGVKKQIEIDNDYNINIEYKKYDIVELTEKSFSLSPNNETIKINNRIKYLNISDGNDKDNVVDLITSYLDSFNYEHDTVLILKYINILEENKNKFIDLIKTCLNKRILNDRDYKFAPIIIDFEPYNYDQLQSLYDNCDVYVNVSYGEGFGIHVYNEYIRNKKVISPVSYGVSDYLIDYKNIYKVKFKDIPTLYNENNILNYSMNCIKVYTENLTAQFKLNYIDYCKEHIENIIEYSDKDIISTYKFTQKNNKIDIPFVSTFDDNTNINGAKIVNNTEIYINLNYIHSACYVVELFFELKNECLFNDKPLKIGKYKVKYYIISDNQALVINFKNEEYQFLGNFINICAYDINNNYYNLYSNREHYQKFHLSCKDKSNNDEIIFKGDYGEFLLNLANNKDNSDKYERKIYLGNQISFYSHRSGWDYVLHEMTCLHSNDGVYFDGFLENNFAWRREESIYKKRIPYTIPWIGFLHNPPNTPPWFSDNNAFCNSILNDPLFKASLKYCKGLFVLSKYHLNFIKHYVSDNIPLVSLYHPTEIPEKLFDINKFKENRNKKIVNIGYWLRRLNSIYFLKVPDNYTKVRLMPGDKSFETIKRLELIESEIYQRYPTMVEKSSVVEMNHIPNDEYDKLLTENIVYLNLYDSSANNAIIECIARCTPIVVNKHPAIIEYLGEDYPLYIDNYQDDVIKLLSDMDIIEYAHLYLKDIQYKVKIDKFLDDFIDSVIYKSI